MQYMQCLKNILVYKYLFTRMRENKAYFLNVESKLIPVYCHMEAAELGACGGGGWTLVMKTDGKKVAAAMQHFCPRRDFAQKAKSRGGTLVTRAYIKDSTYSSNIQSVY